MLTKIRRPLCNESYGGKCGALEEQRRIENPLFLMQYPSISVRQTLFALIRWALSSSLSLALSWVCISVSMMEFCSITIAVTWYLQGGISVLLYFSVLLRTSLDFFVLLRTSWDFFVLLRTSWDFLRLLGTSWYFLILLRTSQDFFVPSGTSHDFCYRNTIDMFCDGKKAKRSLHNETCFLFISERARWCF